MMYARWKANNNKKKEKGKQFKKMQAGGMGRCLFVLTHAHTRTCFMSHTHASYCVLAEKIVKLSRVNYYLNNS